MADANIKLIPLGKSGKFAIVDAEDFSLVCQSAWRLTAQGYARRKQPRRKRNPNATRVVAFMHRLILGVPPGVDVDHINFDRLDNRRQNLRACTPAQNRMNVRKFKGAHSSKFKGVSWHKQHGKWYAYISINRKLTFLGLFHDENEAAKAYDAQAAIHFGEFARLNFPC